VTAASTGGVARLVSGADLRTVAAQLARRPHDMSRVVARCPYGYPAAVEDLPYGADGRPFPTLYYLTCPTLVAGVAALESAGGVQSWARRAAGDQGLARSLAKAGAQSRRRRRELARRYALPMLDGGASLRSGVGGVGCSADARGQGGGARCGSGPTGSAAAIKCLHAHVAHALACPGYDLGAAVLGEVAKPWCDDRRCAAYADAGTTTLAPAAGSRP
jgi:hypothetical protein